MKLTRFDATQYMATGQLMEYIKRQAIEAFWVFLSPLSGLWWAFGKTYPLFKTPATSDE